MFIPRFECPICYTSFKENPKTCPHCGYFGIEQYVTEFENREKNEGFFKNELFNIYKYTKAVYSGKIPYEKDILDVIDYPCEEKTYILGASGKKGLAIVDLHNDEKHVVADNGILAFDHTKSLILNVDEIKNMVLDESQVRILFLGPDVKSFVSGYLIHSYLRYLFVDTKNANFSSDNNVLFNKDKTKLILYSSLKPEKEYTVPESVKEIGTLAFKSLKHLKTLYIPKHTKLHKNSIGNSEAEDFKIERY